MECSYNPEGGYFSFLCWVKHVRRQASVHYENWNITAWIARALFIVRKTEAPLAGFSLRIVKLFRWAKISGARTMPVERFTNTSGWRKKTVMKRTMFQDYQQKQRRTKKHGEILARKKKKMSDCYMFLLLTEILVKNTPARSFFFFTVVIWFDKCDTSVKKQPSPYTWNPTLRNVRSYYDVVFLFSKV